MCIRFFDSRSALISLSAVAILLISLIGPVLIVLPFLTKIDKDIDFKHTRTQHDCPNDGENGSPGADIVLFVYIVAMLVCAAEL